MDDFVNQINSLKENFSNIQNGLNEKLQQIQNENPNICAQITTDFNRIFQLAKNGDLNALNELQNKYRNADNSNI